MVLKSNSQVYEAWTALSRSKGWLNTARFDMVIVTF